jgi:hypothetical protein
MILQGHKKPTTKIAMKTSFTLFITFYFALAALEIAAQQFAWAKSYDIPNTNEVEALAVHDDGSVYAIGVFDAPWTLPFIGDAYILKTTQDGEVVWMETIAGSVDVSDIAAVQDGVIISGQSNGTFSYQGQSYGTSDYYMFVIHINQEGLLMWLHTDMTKFGGHANISVDQQNGIAVRVRGQYNLGDWILIFSEEGNISGSKQISASNTMIVDMAYHNGWVYLNGGFHGLDESIMVDTIEIHRPFNKNVTFVLALNTELVASWVATDTGYLNRDGKIVVDDEAVFAYMEVIRTPFQFRNHLKKFTIDGILVDAIDVPMHSTSTTKYPDMAITPSHIAIFTSNAFDFSSHKLMLFDHNLNLQSEKLVDGLSHLYSGQVTDHNNDLFIAHVYSGDLDFDGELTLPHAGEGRTAYIAKVSNTTSVGVETFVNNPLGFQLFPNPAQNSITIQLPDDPVPHTSIQIRNLTGQTVLKHTLHSREAQLATNHLTAGIYLVIIRGVDGDFATQKLVKY